MSRLRDWLCGPPRNDADLRDGMMPCSHSGSRIAPAMEDPDQRIRCCHCGSPLSDEDLARGRKVADGTIARETEEERRQRIRRQEVERFEERKAWAESLPELVLDLRHGECHFAAVYEPYPPFPGQKAPGHYGMAVPVERLMEASGQLPDEHMERFLEEVSDSIRLKEARSGRSPLPWDAVTLKGKHRPEVYALGYPEGRGLTTNAPAHLDYLVRAREHLAARNLPSHRLFLDRAVRVHVKVTAWWTGDGPPSYTRMRKSGLSLAPVKVGIRI